MGVEKQWTPNYFFRNEKNNLLETNLKYVREWRKNGHQYLEQKNDFNVTKLSKLSNLMYETQHPFACMGGPRDPHA